MEKQQKIVLKNVKEPNSIDNMVAEARLEYHAGKTGSFEDAEELINYLNEKGLCNYFKQWRIIKNAK